MCCFYNQDNNKENQHHSGPKTDINTHKQTKTLILVMPNMLSLCLDFLSQTYPRNWAPVGPTSMIFPASPSPSTIGGMEANLCLLTRRHVTRVGAEQFLGGTIMRSPLCRQPRMAPPRASTMKLTRKLI